MHALPTRANEQNVCDEGGRDDEAVATMPRERVGVFTFLSVMPGKEEVEKVSGSFRKSMGVTQRLAVAG